MCHCVGSAVCLFELVRACNATGDCSLMLCAKHTRWPPHYGYHPCCVLLSCSCCCKFRCLQQRVGGMYCFWCTHTCSCIAGLMCVMRAGLTLERPSANLLQVFCLLSLLLCVTFGGVSWWSGFLCMGVHRGHAWGFWGLQTLTAGK